MASWLTHLRIAAKIKGKIKDIDLDYLMVGSIAPDSGKLDEANKHYEPSEEITHYCRVKDKDKYINLKDFYNSHLKPEDFFLRSDKTRSFYWGYYFHLISDSIWFEKYIEDIKKDYKGENDFLSLLREETAALDFEYLEKNSEDNVFLKFKNIDIKADFFDIFPPQLIYENIEKIKSYYEKASFKLSREYKFLDSKGIDKFIDMAAKKCMEAFYK